MSNLPTGYIYPDPFDPYLNPSTSTAARPSVITTTSSPTVGTGALASPVEYTLAPAAASTVSAPAAYSGTGHLGHAGPSTLAKPVVTHNKVIDKLPSNQQIERTLERVREQVNIAKHETEGLNTTGEKILWDTERLVDSATLFLREKNEGEKLQQLAREGYLAQLDLTAQARDARDSWDVVEGFDSDRLRTLARQTLQTARMAGMEILRSRKFRSQVRSLINLLAEAISMNTSADGRSSDSDVPVEDLGASAASLPSHASTSTGREREIPIEGGVGLSKRLEQGLSLGRGRKLRLNQEQMNQLADRFVELLRDITRRPSTAQLLRNMLDIFHLFEEEIDSEQRSQVTGGLRNMANSEHLRRTLALAQELFETFTGDRTLDPLINHLRAIAIIFRRDEEARAYFHSLRSFFVDILDHPELLGERETLEEMKKHIRWAQNLHDEKLHHHLSGVLLEAKVILRQVEHDPATLRLKNDAKALLADIILDEQGNIVLKTEALEQLRLIVIQCLVERVRFPVPSITINNPDIQLRLSNVHVTLRDLLPESVLMTNRGRMAVDLTHLKEGIDISSEGEELVFEIKNMNLYIEDADVWFKRTKFPKVEDEGKIRINIGGSGVDLTLILRAFMRSKDILQVERVNCDIHNLQLHLYETRHNFLYNAIVKVLSGKIKRNIERSVESNIANHLDRLNRVLTKQIAVARSKGSNLMPVKSLRNRITSGEARGVTAGETQHAIV